MFDKEQFIADCRSVLQGDRVSRDVREIVARAGIEGETVFFEVEDDGRGIPADQLERIFDRFHQVDGSASREHVMCWPWTGLTSSMQLPAASCMRVPTS